PKPAPEPPRARAPVARKVAARAPEETIKAAPRKEPVPPAKTPSEDLSPKTEGEDQSEADERGDADAETAANASAWNALIGVGGAGAVSRSDRTAGSRRVI